ncbi:MAG: uracil-DNA glycosylase [Treponema sp.]|nr:uracil-DNA glycosylase [Treponema sp.]
MTVNEKTAIARFLNLAADYLRDGHRREWETPEFSAELDSAVAEQSSATSVNLPLAYQVDEDEEPDLSSEYPAETKSLPLPLVHGSSSPAPNDSLEAVAADIRACKACGLAPTRTLAVPGEGVERPLVMVIGEGPGADEDRAGRPFVGRAGQLLDKMLQSIGLSRNKNCFIANTVKCRPPGNRPPAPEEIAACFPYLQRQIALLRPKVILCAGGTAAQTLFKTSMGINALRGAFGEYRMNKSDGLSFEGNDDDEDTPIPVLCTFHPSFLLRDETRKRPAWEDLKLLKARLDTFKE